MFMAHCVYGELLFT